MKALALSDLRGPDPEPRIHDLRLAEALGFSQDYAIRKLIERNAPELEKYGPVFSMAEKTSVKGGRPGTAYLLNEEQALLICMFARTERAAAVRKQVIEVFMAWRRGHGLRHDDANQNAPAPLPEWSTARSLDEAVFNGRRRFGLPDLPPEKLALIYKIPPRGRRSPIWDDEQVFVFLVATHRRVRLPEALKRLEELVGPARTPPVSSAHRFWQRLDEAASATWADRRLRQADSLSKWR